MVLGKKVKNKITNVKRQEDIMFESIFPVVLAISSSNILKAQRSKSIKN